MLKNIVVTIFFWVVANIEPFEVKTGRTGTKSLNAVLQNENIPYGFKFSSQNIGKQDKKITMPLYLLPFIDFD